ncbi:hypothetical protein C4A75_00915 [Brevibacillus laterosporus]|nr:hypothetical protein C4A75_00915 [Brevibacillus laterosporus]
MGYKYGSPPSKNALETILEGQIFSTQSAKFVEGVSRQPEVLFFCLLLAPSFEDAEQSALSPHNIMLTFFIFKKDKS